MKKRITSISVVAIMVLSLLLAACGAPANNAPAASSAPEVSSAPSGESAPQSNAPAEKIKACFIGPMSGGAAWGQAEQGFVDACNEYGWESQYLAPVTTNNYSEMINLAETAITNGAKILVTPIMDVEMWANTLDRAKEAGVIIIAVNADDPDRCLAQIGTIPESIGVAAAEALTSKMQGKDIFVSVMLTNLTNPVANRARDAFKKKIAELDPGATILQDLECDSNASKAQDNLAALKLSDDRLNSMISIDSYAGLGAAAFVEERGLQGEFFVVGMDDAPEILRCIQEGAMVCTVALNWYETGYGAGKIAKTAVDGGSVEYINDAGVEVVFLENVETYAATKGIDLEK